MNIQPGFRIDYHENLKDLYFQPRIDATINLNGKWKINLAWGMYNQYVTEIPLVDELNNYFYYWGLCDNISFPVIEGIHNVLGFSYKQNGFKFSTEGFYKTTKGLSRMNFDSRTGSSSFNTGNSRSYGVDFYIKKEIKKHELWISYTLSNTEEHFDYFNDNKYQRAPHDQTHELKSAAILNFKPWFASFNYVYGSGLVNSSDIIDKGIIPYNRLDVAFLYKFQTQKLKLEAGLSIVNLLNVKNIGYNDFSNLPDYRTFYSQAMPFTPSIFVNIGF